MKGFTLWFTGLPGSGKSTLAREVEAILLERGMKVEVLDGDEVRRNLSPELGFTREERNTHIRRLGWICRLLTRNGVAAVVAAVSPYRAGREENRNAIGRFVEVHCACDIATLKRRDPKGLYARAERGEIEHFTGISDPYEPPENPEVVVHTGRESVDTCVRRILGTLEKLGWIPAVEAAGYRPEEEEAIARRLEELGYL